jgi:hypothetical protein
MEIEFEQARRAISDHILLALWVARHAARKIRPRGTLLFMGGTGARRPARGFALVLGGHRCDAHVRRRPRARSGSGSLLPAMTIRPSVKVFCSRI